MKTKFIVLLSLVCVSFYYPYHKSNFDAGELCGELEGYTLIECTNTAGDFEGADTDKPVKLDNGMIFTFNETDYQYSYRPDVAIFYNEFTYQGKLYKSYKLMIEDSIYDVTRIR